MTRPSRKTLLAAVALSLPAIAAMGGLAGWLSRRPPEPPRAVVEAPRADPLARLPKDLAAMLVRPAFDAPSPFIRLTRVRPEPFCESLRGFGLGEPAFRRPEPPQRGWTCTSDLIKPIPGDDAAVSSLFVAVRGFDDDRIENIRMKLNLIDPASAPAVRLLARDMLAGVSRGLGWEPPARALAALDRLETARFVERGVSYDLRREFGDALRLNLIVIFPRLIGAGGEGRFVTDPRRGPVTR